MVIFFPDGLFRHISEIKVVAILVIDNTTLRFFGGSLIDCVRYACNCRLSLWYEKWQENLNSNNGKGSFITFPAFYKACNVYKGIFDVEYFFDVIYATTTGSFATNRFTSLLQ